MSSTINNFVSPFYTSVIGNDTNENELQAEIDDLKEDLANNYYNKIESDERYLNQTSTSKWNLNSIDGTIYPRDYEKVAIGQDKVTAQYDLDVSGTIRTNDMIVSKIKADNSFGQNGQVLKTDGTKVYWGDISGSGGDISGEIYWIKSGDEISYKEGNVNIGKDLLISNNDFVKNNTIASGNFSYHQLIEFGQEVTIGSIQSPSNGNVYLSFNINGTAGSQNSLTDVLAGVRVLKNNSYLPLTELYIQTNENNDKYNLSQNNVFIGNDFFPLTVKAFCVGVGDYIDKINFNYNLTTDKGIFNIKVGDLFNTDVSNELVDISGSLKIKQIIDVNNSSGNFSQVLTKGNNGIQWGDISGGIISENFWKHDGNTLINDYSDKVDISGNLLINKSIFTQKSNVIVGTTGNQQEILNGTFNNPSFMAGGETYILHTINNLTNYLSNNSLSVRITGIGATLAGQGQGFLNGGVRVLDKNNTVVLDVKVNNNWLDGIGHFDVTGATTTTISPENFPLRLQQYVVGGGSWIEDLTAYLTLNYQKYTDSIHGFDVYIPTLLSSDISNNKLDVSGQINAISIKPTYIKDISNNTGTNSQILSSTTNGIKWVDLPTDTNNWTKNNNTIVNNNSSIVDVSGELKTNTIVMKNYRQIADNNNNWIINKSGQEFLKLEESLQPFEQTISGTSFTIPFIDRVSQSASTYSTYMNTPTNFPAGTQTIYITLKTTGYISNCTDTGTNSRSCELPVPKIDNAMWFEFLDGGLNLLCRQILNGDDYHSNISSSPFSIEDTFAVEVNSITFPFVLHYRKPNTIVSLDDAITTYTIRYFSEEPVKTMTLSGDMYADNYYGLIHPASLKDSLIACDNVKVGSNTIYLDGLNNKIGVSTSTPQACLDISQNVSNAMKIGNFMFVDSSNNIVIVNGDISANNIYNKTQVDLSLTEVSNRVNEKLNTSTFNSTIANYYNKNQVDLSFAQINNAVLLTNNQTIGGTKTFSSPIIADVSGSITRATNISGGSAGSIPYQSASGTTSFTSVGSAGQILQSNGTSAPTWVAPNTVPNTTVTTSSDATNAGRFVAFKSALSGSLADLTNNNFQYNPSTNRLSAGTFVGNLEGTATNATNASAVNTVVDTTAANRPVVFKNTATLPGNAGDLYNSSFVYNPGTNTLTAGTFSGALSGNATNASAVNTVVDTAAANRPVVFKNTATLPGNAGDLYNSSFSYNPGTNTLTAGTFSGALSGNATSASAVNTVVDTAAANRPVVFKNTATLPGNAQDLYNSKFQYNPGTNTLTAGTFSGSLSGNATSATTASGIQLINGLTPTSTGTAGQIGYDGNYIYVCIATNTWKRVLITSW